MAKNREYSLHYLNQQYSAMRWLAKQGLTPEEIREMTWGKVDEVTKTIKLVKKVVFIKYDPIIQSGVFDEEERELHIPIRGTGHEWFFLESKFKCPWMFTQFSPVSWRKKESRVALFPLEVVEKCCRDLLPTDRISTLTDMDFFGNIEISKLNVTKMKTAELEDKAMQAVEAKN